MSNFTADIAGATPATPSKTQKTGDKKQSALILGKRIKHFRKKSGLTLVEVSEKIGLSVSQLSLYETGKREPKISVLAQLAAIFTTDIKTLLTASAPSKRAELEIKLLSLQQSELLKELQIPPITNPQALSENALETIVTLSTALHEQSREKAASSEGARHANTLIRQRMHELNNYLPEIEKLAEELMAQVGHTNGALTHRTVAVLAEKLGFELIFVEDLPQNTRSITDLENGRIYLPPASIPGGHGLRALALQAMAHRILKHKPPSNYAEFLRHRLEINYFSSACLIPETAAKEFLLRAKQNRNLAIEDFRDAFGVTHETAAHRFTNLATTHLDLPVHFYRTDTAGLLIRGFANDGLVLPTDSAGNAEGQILCRKFPGRTAFQRRTRTSEFYQYTDTPAGTFWSSVQTGEAETSGGFSITCGVAFSDAKWFRGSDTTVRRVSKCPSSKCCKLPSTQLRNRWQNKSWASAKMHQYILAPLPSGDFPGVDETEMYEFLSRHAPSS
ncbi:helix-turn-helix domain-containing protein [Canibacter sp. lx-45]|uniref:helix-turn-helix transcriptional regulator n=1 Tax=Canibacter zhuwentaonis TaxID=2837491 RepID=UPI001BDDA80F|nr:helix-turn-helix transcriptional regulator [Canibacter zhuwentaonis]MBT1034807.1 helix-turn-helix domain-containing protein [Canibacter zhuwentaonis]